MKRVLIISPYFPPSNAADMQRVRMSLPYFAAAGWNAEVVCVKQKHSEVSEDDLLLRSLPKDRVVYEVDAFDRKWTSKIGLGSLALRSMWYYFKHVNKLLRQRPYDLVYFSTTQFPLTILGRYWKNRFHIPYVIDMQDPWHSDYYQGKSKELRPPKYWFSYRLNKWLEPVAIRKVDGLISVSEGYIDDLKTRYPQISAVPAETITFGFFEPDRSIALSESGHFEPLLDKKNVNIVYIGRGGGDMHRAVIPLLLALKRGLNDEPSFFGKLKLYFIGTSYAPKGRGRYTIYPLAEKYGVQQNVVEITERISYYHALSTLQQADALFIPGSDDPKYTASKLYPYVLANKPLLAILHQHSPALEVLKNCTRNAVVHTFQDDAQLLADVVFTTLKAWSAGQGIPVKQMDTFERYNARALTQRQVELFENAIKHFKKEYRR